MASSDTRDAAQPSAARDRPDVFISYAREDMEFVEQQLTEALVAHGKDVWIDVEDIRGGASDWRATVWAGIESATVMVFVLTPDSLSSTVCGEEVQRADELNKRIIPILRRSVDGLEIPPPLSRPNWILLRPEDDFDASVTALIDALELDEAWVERHARLNQRTGEWLRHDRNGSYLLRGSDLDDAERWLDDQAGHREAPTADQISYITSSRRAATRRLRGLLAGVALALVITMVLAVVAFVQRERAIDREKTARAQARVAESSAALARGDPEEGLRAALAAVEIRPDLPEATYYLRRSLSAAGWTRMFRPDESGAARLLDVEFSEDGRRVATAGSDGTVVVWDTRTGQRIADITTGGMVHTVQFSPDARQVLTASVGGLVETWDGSSGTRLRRFKTGSDDASSATWGAAGRRILTVSPLGGLVWDATTGKMITRLPSTRGNPGRIRMSLDGRHVLMPGTNGTARFWNLATDTSVSLPGTSKTDSVEFSLLSRNGRRIVTVFRLGAFCVWDDGRPPSRRFCEPGSGSTDADLSRDGRRFLRANNDGVVEVWDTASEERIARLRTHTAVSTAQFDRSGEYVVTGANGGSGQIWQVRPKQRVAVLQGHTREVRRARFSPNGSVVATVSDDGSARLWPALPMPSDPAWRHADSTTFSPNSRDVLVVRGRRRAVWNLESGRIVPLEGGINATDPLMWPCGRAAGCSPWDPDGRYIAGGNGNGRAAIWNARTGKVDRALGPRDGNVIGAEFGPDGDRLLVVDGNQKRATIWDLATDRPWRRVPAERAARAELFGARFVPSPLRVITVDTAERATVSDLTTGTTFALRGNVDPPAVAASPEGEQIALGTTGGELSVFSGVGSPPRTSRATDAGVNTVAFDREGAAIVTGYQNGGVILWDAQTLTPAPLPGIGSEEVSGASFSPNGDVVLVTSGATARLWDRRLRRVIVALPRTPNVQAEFSPDGSRIVVAGATRLEVLRCNACASDGELPERARSLLGGQ